MIDRLSKWQKINELNVGVGIGKNIVFYLILWSHALRFLQFLLTRRSLLLLDFVFPFTWLIPLSLSLPALLL